MNKSYPVYLSFDRHKVDKCNNKNSMKIKQNVATKGKKEEEIIKVANEMSEDMFSSCF